MVGAFIDRTGHRYGQWTVIARASNRAGVHQAQWLCRCNCGVERVVDGSHLGRGASTSCGCRRVVTVRELFTTHGKSGTPEHRTWKSMIGRCENSRNKRYYLYGGRGISVCKRWRRSFKAFLADMGQRPSPRHSIDRIDNDGNYTPKNCRWATQSQQMRNSRSARLITKDGRTLSIVEWGEVLGIRAETIYARIRRGHDALGPLRKLYV